MNKKVVFFLFLCVVFVQPSRAALGLIVRVGMIYTSYKFVDGLFNGSISNVVDKYIDGPVDAVYSFGKGVQTFGNGVRKVFVGLYNNKTDDSFSNLWKKLKSEFDYSISIIGFEWSIRRELSISKKESDKKKENKLEDKKDKKQFDKKNRLESIF